MREKDTSTQFAAAMLAALAPIAGSRPHVAVYRGDGAGLRSVQSTVSSLQQLLPPVFKVATMDTQQLLLGGWQEQCALLVMPGGADLPYCRRLNGHGNQLIRSFVCGGGAYLGLCAGAYYACSRVEFEPGSKLEVVGDRELGFFPGTAVGAAYPGFDYLTEAGAAGALLVFQPATGPAAAADLDPASTPADDTLSGAASAPTGTEARHVAAGSPAKHTGWVACVDYSNGGPVFRPHQPTTSSSGSSSGSSCNNELPPGITPLAFYAMLPERPHMNAQTLNRPLPAAAREAAAAAAQQQHVVAIGTGPESAAAETHPLRTALAAVRCEVGQGAAVLCGTHPELPASWLHPRGASLPAWQHTKQPALGNGSTNKVVPQQQVQQEQGEAPHHHQQQPCQDTSTQQQQQERCTRQDTSRQQQQQRALAATSQLSSRLPGVPQATAPATEHDATKHDTQQQQPPQAGAQEEEEEAGQEPADDADLVWQTAALQQQLASCQPSRELLLATLLWEVLRHQLPAAAPGADAGTT